MGIIKDVSKSRWVILDKEEDEDIPVIMGKPFLTTSGALIDVLEWKITLRVENEEVIFDVLFIHAYYYDR